MVNRAIGLKQEEKYGELKKGVKAPDFHQRVQSMEVKLGDETTRYNQGSRKYHACRRGIAKPSGSTESYVDLQRVGHYLKAFFDQYHYSYNKIVDKEEHQHHFWGDDDQDLTSFHGWATFDYFEKSISGIVIDSLSIECSDALTLSSEFFYKNETARYISAMEYEFREVTGAVPIQQYDVHVSLDGMTEEQVVITSLTVDFKNNLDQDGSIGLGSRYPQRKATAGAREIEISMEAKMSQETKLLELIRKAEYGGTGQTPTDEIVLVPLKVKITPSATPESYMVIYFPNCEMTVEYDAPDEGQIEVSFTLVPYNAKLKTFDKDSDYEHIVPRYLKDKDYSTDCFIYLQNDQKNINDGNPEGENFTLDGHVYLSEDKQSAVANEKIQVMKGDKEIGETTTSGIGAFRISGLSEGQYTLKITHKKEVRQTSLISISNEDVHEDFVFSKLKSVTEEVKNVKKEK